VENMGLIENSQILMYSLKPVFRNKTVLITGHTGFKGSWLALWLHSLGARVCGYALPPPTTPGNFCLSKIADIMSKHLTADVRDFERLSGCLLKVRPDFIFHLAAQPLVRESYRSPRDTFETNVGGTVNLLEALRLAKRPCNVVVVTSDKCYENTGLKRGYGESDPMGGHDPYSASKGAAEIVIASYRSSFFNPKDCGRHGVKLASARSGNVIGGGDWATDRILPDCISALTGGGKIIVRNPDAVRPWQHVLEPLSGYLLLAAGMAGKNGGEYCEAWNFGPSAKNARSVRELVEKVIRQWGGGAWQKTGEKNAPHEAHYLTLCSRKANKLLGWKNIWGFERAVEKTVCWYKAWHNKNTDLQNLCLAQIEEYCRRI